MIWCCCRHQSTCFLQNLWWLKLMRTLQLTYWNTTSGIITVLKLAVVNRCWRGVWEEKRDCSFWNCKVLLDGDDDASQSTAAVSHSGCAPPPPSVQVPGGPVERLQHQTALGRGPAPQPSLRQPAARRVQLAAAGQLVPRGDAASAALQTWRPLRNRHPGAQRRLQGDSAKGSGKELPQCLFHWHFAILV